MSGLLESILRRVEEIGRAASIPCPHCGEPLVDEDREFVSFDGGESPTACAACGGEFVVVERVERRYETRF
jgi:hypothetical protein